MALPCPLNSAARGKMKAGTRYLTLARSLTDVDFGPHMGCMHMACRGMYLRVTTTIPTGGRLDMPLPPLHAVLYGPVRRPSVSRVDLTVTVFRSQIFGPFIAHYDNLRPHKSPTWFSASTDTMARTRRWLAVHGVTCGMDFVCLSHSSQQEPVV